MRKLPLLIMIVLLASAGLYAADALTDSYMYLVPTSSSAIDLTSIWYPTRDGYISNPSGLHWIGQAFPSSGSPSESDFYDANILLSGGYSNEDGYSDERALLDGGKVVLSVSTNTNSLEFTSLSDSSYKRPFIVYAFFSTNRGGTHSRIALLKMDSVNTTFSSGTLSNFYRSSYYNTAVFFDLILALPGSFVDGTTTFQDTDGTEYSLKEGDDYSVMLTINMEFLDEDERTIGTKSITMPLSGYISLSSSTPTKASLAVNLNPVFNVVDLEKYAGQKIDLGEMNMMLNYGTSRTSSTTAKIFLSSSNSPYVSGDKFSFKRKKDVLAGNIIGDSNSLKFDLTLTDRDTTAAAVTFYGDEYMNQSTGAMVTGSYIGTNQSSDTMGTVRHAGTYYYWDYLNADISMTLDSPPQGMLQEGLYEETVYVHVMSGL